jgi:hypothetical protein
MSEFRRFGRAFLGHRAGCVTGGSPGSALDAVSAFLFGAVESLVGGGDESLDGGGVRAGDSGDSDADVRTSPLSDSQVQHNSHEILNLLDLLLTQATPPRSQSRFGYDPNLLGYRISRLGEAAIRRSDSNAGSV